MKPLTAKVPNDLMERVDDRAEERDTTRSKAARDLLYAGLDATDEDEDNENTAKQARETVRHISTAFGAIYIYLWYTGNQSSLITVSGTYLVVMVLWSFSPAIRRLGEKARERIK